MQIRAESTRSPTLAARVDPIFRTVRGVMSDLVARYQRQGLLSGTAAAGELADILLATLQGTILRHAVPGDVDLDLDALRHGPRARWRAQR